MFLQEIRARQACEEAGITVTSITIDHAAPRTIVNGVTRPLLFPRSLLNFRDRKTIHQLFLGHITPAREEFLSKFPDATIYVSERGRSQDTRHYDSEYFTWMGRASFVRCPSGDFAWTYRFFEATACGAIPIVERVADCYDGYKFYQVGDPLVRNDAIAEWNLIKTMQELMLPRH